MGLSLIGLICLTHCKKNNPPTIQAPVINSVNPTSGSKNTLVTITGSHFGTDSTKVTVLFNGVHAVLKSVSDTLIKVLVPPAANTGKINIRVGAQSVDGPIFTYIPSYTVSTLAGNGTKGLADGAADKAEFDMELGDITIDGQGNLLLADMNNNAIRKITSGLSPIVSTFYSEKAGSKTPFCNPQALVFDKQGNLLVGESCYSSIASISTSSILTVLSNNGEGFADGVLGNAMFFHPTGFAVDANGSIYVADADNNCIRKITSGTVSTFAGNPSKAGFADGTGSSALFSTPFDLAFDSKGNLFVTDANNAAIRKITAAGVVSTYCGKPGTGITDGDLSSAHFSAPRGIAIDANDNIFIVDDGGLYYQPSRIRRITSNGAVTTIAGASGQGYENGDGSTAKFKYPARIVIDAHGDFYITDAGNNRIRKMTTN